MGYLYIDCETGGTCDATHSIVQFALGAVVDGKRRTMDMLVCEPEIVMVPAAVEVHGLSEAHLREHGRTPQECAVATISFIAECRLQRPSLVGWNVGFDFGFMRRLFRLSGLANPIEIFNSSISHRPLDLQSALRFLADQGFPSPPLDGAKGFGLREAMQFYELPSREAHNALKDMLMAMDLHDAMQKAIRPPVMESDS